MEKPLTQRQEIYCQQRAAGLTQRAAYRVAYPRSQAWKDETVDSAASRLEAGDKVSARCHELMAKAAAEAAKKAAWTLERSMRVRLDKLERGEGAAQALAKVSGGLRVDRDAETVIDNAVRDLDKLARLDEPAPASGILRFPLIDTARLISPNFIPLHRDLMAHGHGEYELLGGRGSLKSSYSATALWMLILSDPEAHAIGLRKVANTLRRSVYATVLWAAHMLGIESIIRATVSPMEVVLPATGQHIIFSGVDEPEKLKSLTFPAGKLKFALWEEYDQFDGPEAVRNVEQSIIRADDFVSIKCFNPPADKAHWANEDAELDKADRLVHRSTYLEAPPEWLGAKFIAKARELETLDPQAYANEYKGEATGLAGTVFRNVVVWDYDAELIEGMGYRRNGVDWGFVEDPWVFGRVAYDRKKRDLYLYDEDYGVGLFDPDTAERAIARMKDEQGCFSRSAPENECICDSAEQKAVATWRTCGINARGVVKARSVSPAARIKWLAARSHIYIDRRRCPLAYQEFTRYAVVDGKYPDKNNHWIDAAGYACTPLINDKKET